MQLFDGALPGANGADALLRPGCSVECAATTLAGEVVELLPQRALYWPAQQTLFVADVHLGKAAAFRAGGVPIPRGTTAKDLDRLTALITVTGARRLIVLGDLLHAAAGRVAALHRAVMGWREAHRALDMTLVRGNHDSKAGDPPSEWDVRVVTEPFLALPFLLCHHPHDPPTGYALCGHIHPGVSLHDEHGAIRLPCFVLGRRRALLPAFGRFTGLAMVPPAAGQRVVAVAGDK